MEFEIVTDTSANLLDEDIEAFGLHILPLTFMSDGKQYKSYSQGEKSNLKRFFDMMREGKVFTTSLPNQADTEKLLRGILESGRDLLYIGFSSGLSGTYEATAGILDSLRTSYPGRKIFHVDTRAAAMGEGLLVYYAAKMAQDGASIEETHNWVEAHKWNLAHWFTVDDLMFLFRGGRVSRTSAWAGSLLNIKPVMHVDNDGKLIPMEKVRGRKKSINAMFKHMQESAIKPVEDQWVFISHADCEEDALYLKGLIEKEWGCKNFKINYLDPVIGAHTGPGCLALFFMADKR